MTTIPQSNGRTAEAASSIFAEVLPWAREMLAKRYKEPEVVDAFIARIEGLQDHPKFSGLSADAVRETLRRSFKAFPVGKDSAPVESPLERVTVEHILKSVPNVDAPKQTAEVRDNVVQMLKERAKAPASHAPTHKETHVSRFGTQDHLLIGMSAFAAAISICHGVATLWQASTADKDDPLVPKVPSSTYMMAAAQILLGTGMAALAHHQYKNPTGVQL